MNFSSKNMARHKSAREVWFRIRLNAELCAIKLFVSIMKVCPAKLTLLKALSRLDALVSSRIDPKRRAGVFAFADHIGEERRSAFANKYFIGLSKCRVFTTLFYEAPDCLRQYISMQGHEALMEAAAHGKGLVILGAHYGPAVITDTLTQKGFDIRTVYATDWRAFIEETSGRTLPGLMRNRWVFMADPARSFVAGRDERRILRHLNTGGAVVMTIDAPRDDAGGTITDFLGRELRLNHFPFKLALKYDVPVFFYATEETHQGYVIDFNAVAFDSAEDGLAQYAAFFSDRIRRSPHLWRLLPKFCAFGPPDSRGEARRPEKPRFSLES